MREDEVRHIDGCQIEAEFTIEGFNSTPSRERTALSNLSQKYARLVTRYQRRDRSMRLMGKRVVVAMALKAAQAQGLLESSVFRP